MIKDSSPRSLITDFSRVHKISGLTARKALDN